MIKIYAPRTNVVRRNRFAEPFSILFIVAGLTRTEVSVVRWNLSQLIHSQCIIRMKLYSLEKRVTDTVCFNIFARVLLVITCSYFHSWWPAHALHWNIVTADDPLTYKSISSIINKKDNYKNSCQQHGSKMFSRRSCVPVKI